MVGEKVGQNGFSLMDVYSYIFVKRLDKITQASVKIIDVLGEGSMMKFLSLMS
jgi:hypothetical protein